MLGAAFPAASATMGDPPTPPLSPTPRRRGARSDMATPKHRGGDDAEVTTLEPDTATELAAFVASVEAQWARKKANWLARLKMSVSDTEAVAGPDVGAVLPDGDDLLARQENDSTCHVCNVALRLYRLRHRCRNCNRAVCGVHSKNQVPLPHLGIMKEVRVCDICTRALVQRRAGYRSPRARKPRASTSGEELAALIPELNATTSAPASASTSGYASEPHSPMETATPTMRVRSQHSQSQPLHPIASKESQLLGTISGVLYSCLLEEQANIMDEILYLGTFTMGGRALASRHMNANVAIWKDRWFMLTSAELLCFRATDDDKTAGSVAALGELRSSVHLTDILHVEINDQYPRILTVIRSDGRIFRVRAKTAEQCQEISIALRKAQQLFQDAMHKLQRGVQPEDYTISCVTIQHESSLPERVVVSSPLLDEKMRVEMYPSSILRFYVNGPEANGVAQYSCQMLISSMSRRDDTLQKATPIVSEADPLRSSPSDSKVLRVSLLPSPVSSSFTEAKEQKTRAFWSAIAGLIAVGAYLNYRQWTFLEVMVWLVVLVMGLTRFHDPLLLLLTTTRVNRAKRFCVECVDITYGRKSDDGGDDDDGADGDGGVDLRFLEGCNGDVEEAKSRYAETMQWREEQEIDKILMRPLPQFADMKASYLHAAHKKDKFGHVVSFEHFGYMKKMRDDFLARGVTEEEAIRHHVFLQEYLWEVIDSRPFPDGNALKVFDIKGISMSDVSGDVFTFMKTLGVMVAQYNPERVYQIFIVNPPSWFNLIWKLVSPSINPKTRERVHVVRGQKEIAKALLEFVEESDLPPEYGGKCNCPGGCLTNSPEERDMREFVENYLNTFEEGDPRIQQALEALKSK